MQVPHLLEGPITQLVWPLVPIGGSRKTPLAAAITPETGWQVDSQFTLLGYVMADGR